MRLFPLRADPSSLHHSHLAFSFDAAGCTDVLLLRGDSFTQTSIPGTLCMNRTLGLIPRI